MEADSEEPVAAVAARVDAVVDTKAVALGAEAQPVVAVAAPEVVARAARAARVATEMEVEVPTEKLEVAVVRTGSFVDCILPSPTGPSCLLVSRRCSPHRCPYPTPMVEMMGRNRSIPNQSTNQRLALRRCLQGTAVATNHRTSRHSPGSCRR